MTSILEIKKIVQGSLLKVDGVAGIGVDRKTNTIMIYTERDPITLDEMLPDMIGGYPVKIVITGKLSPVDTTYRRMSYRPLVGGVSGAHAASTAGTIGGILADAETGAPLMLSNAHVLAMPTSGNANVGDIIVQPSPYDGGTVLDHAGNLLRWAVINGVHNQSEASNLVDGAVADIKGSVESVKFAVLKDDVGNLIEIRGIRSPELGGVVYKLGRTTGYTSGHIIDVDATIQIDYSTDTEQRFATFEDQILSTARVEPGDSGSLLMDRNNYAVGLICAANSQYAVANKMRNTVLLLGIAEDCAGLSVGDTECVGNDLYEYQENDTWVLLEENSARCIESVQPSEPAIIFWVSMGILGFVGLHFILARK